MTRLDIDRLSDDATIWIFPTTGGERLLPHVDAFLEQWTAHGASVTAGRDLREGVFLIIAAEKESETSGCSIDRLFALIRSLDPQMLDASRVFFRGEDGKVRHATRAEFGALAGPATIVFDTTAQRLGEIRSGAWERAARDSWHARLIA